MDPEVISALERACAAAGVDEWGVAANRDWPLAPDLPFAVALVGRHAPDALASLEQTHMSQAFFDDYARLWRVLDEAAAGVVAEIEARGHTAVQSGNLMSGPHDDPPVDDWGDPGVFSHKIAATQAGLGWIGKTAVFVSARFGAAVRLTTVFTDLPLPRCGTAPQTLVLFGTRVYTVTIRDSREVQHCMREAMIRRTYHRDDDLLLGSRREQ